MKNSHFVTSILIVTLLSFGLVHWTINEDPNATRASWIMMFGFIFLIVMMIKKFNVDSKNLMLPSIVIYVLFTIVETYSLMKLSKSR